MEHHELPHDHCHEKKEKYDEMINQLERCEDFAMVSETMKMLSDMTRARLFWLLCHCEECVINISAMMNMSSPAISHHLRALKTSGLIVSRREGKEVYYKAADNEVCRLLHKTMEQVMDIVCP